MVKQYQLPFSNVINIKQSGCIDSESLIDKTSEVITEGVCIILKDENSTDQDGGFLFNVKQESDNVIDIFSIQKRKMVSLKTFQELAHFINHHSGRRFYKDQWLISQQLNFLLFNEEIAPY